MRKIKISAVSYANTYPFLYGMDKKLNADLYKLSIDVPSECARKLKDNEVDLGLIPVAVIPEINNATIISDYCIGANGKVKTVLLMSNVPLNEITKVYLDTESRTSVQLLKVLAKEYWGKNWKYDKLPSDFKNKKDIETILLIGDKTQQKLPYKYIYDLSHEWEQFTGKPFVFAAWVSNKTLPKEFIDDFNNAILYGLEHVSESITKYNTNHKYDLNEYLTNYISYNLDTSKKEALNLFLQLIK